MSQVVPRLATLVKTLSVEKDYSINTMLKLGGWFQTLYFDQEE